MEVPLSLSTLESGPQVADRLVLNPHAMTDNGLYSSFSTEDLDGKISDI